MRTFQDAKCFSTIISTLYRVKGCKASKLKEVPSVCSMFLGKMKHSVGSGSDFLKWKRLSCLLFGDWLADLIIWHSVTWLVLQVNYGNVLKLYEIGFIIPPPELLEPQPNKSYLQTCASSEDSNQPAHSRSLILIFTGRIFDSQGCKVSSCGQWRF